MTTIHLIEALEVVRDVMGDESLTIKNVVDKVSEKSGKPVKNILGWSRRAEVVHLRQGVYYIFREKFRFGYYDISYLTRRPARAGTREQDYMVDRTTVISGIERIRQGFKDHEEHLL